MSSKHHHHHHGETKKQIYARRILAFFLFLCISLLSLTACLRLCVLSKGSVIKALTSETYVSGVYENAIEFSRDLCDNCSVPYECVEASVNYDSVYRVQKAYYYGLFSASNEYTDTTYIDYIAEIGKSVEEETLAVIKKYNIQVEGDVKKTVNAFAKVITDYITRITEISFSQRIKTVIAVGSTASVIAIAAIALVAIVLALIIVSIGKKPYRTVRELAYSFFAAALLNLVLVIGVECVKHFKTLLIYPDYLCKAVYEYVNGAIAGVCVSSAVLTIIGLAVASVVWAMKRTDTN